jgi:hypothetical protein
LSDEQLAANRTNNPKKKDLELLLLGSVLAKGKVRDQVFAAIPSGAMTGENGAAFEAIRSQDTEQITLWFADRGCNWDGKQGFVQAVIDCTLEDAERRTIVFLLTSLAGMAKTGTRQQLKERATALLKQISEM